MIVMDKELYQISNQYESNAIPIEWNKLPDDIINNISSELLYNKLSFSKEKGICEKTVIYFRKVKKFRKDIKNKYETDILILGI